MSDDDRKPTIRPRPFAAGILLGSVTGFLIWIATGTFALFPAFVSIGFVLGLVFSRASGGGPQ
ncbi:hypothetical protein [Demequina mangrovi]|uniref:Uncharacterized protein n=1 Tax=Demequina mangrovi TaxID=1043493 RepID=A0A1H6TYP9_9MICO|nr:hypothetical protein [Demequina mangrovi]SEI81380.1 hypothetical protein SAMN05421637_0080 [Demequina mangrovi]